MAEFNLDKVFRDAFGYQPPTTTFSVAKAPDKKMSTAKGQKLYAEDLAGREFFLPVEINDVLIPFAVMSMNWRKTIVSTPMPERGGSVHELISIDDYTFNIKGLLVDEDGFFPEQGIVDLHDVFLLNKSLRMKSALSAIVLQNGEQVIIKDVKWPHTPGVEHVKAFEIELESDQIFELELK